MDQDFEDLDDEIFSDFQEESNPEQIKVFAQEFFSDVKVLAKHYLELFFSDKPLHCGGKIPKSFLFADRRISMVINYDICKGVDRAYKALENTLSREELVLAQFGEATSDIRLVNETLKLLARSGIPQQFAGGMMCLYLEFVEGINIGTEP